MGRVPRTDIYVKVVVDHDEQDTPEKLGAEICRQIEYVYGVRTAEMTNFITRPVEQ